MDIMLPGPIADYFAADKGKNAEAISACFTDDACLLYTSPSPRD